MTYEIRPNQAVHHNFAGVPARPQLKALPEAGTTYQADRYAAAERKSPELVVIEPVSQGWLSDLRNLLGGLQGGKAGHALRAGLSIVTGIAKGLWDTVTGFFQPAPQPPVQAPPATVAAPVADARTELDRLIDEAFAWRDADRNGALEGAELAGSADVQDPALNLSFDPVNVGRLDREQFRQSVKGNLGRVRQEDAEARIAAAYHEVFGYALPGGQAREWYLAMHRGGKSVAEIKAWMVRYKADIEKAKRGG